jgi:hypothetical protein
MLSQEQFLELKQVLSTIDAYIPEHQAGYIWDMYTKIAGDHGGRPCMCGSAGKYWKAAVDTLRKYVNANG